MKEMKVRGFCNKEFLSRYLSCRKRFVKFCSRKCYNGKRAIRRKCLYCKGDIGPGKGNKYFCSHKCHGEYRTIHITGPMNPRYGGEKIVDSDGYVRMYAGYRKRRT